MDRGPDFENMNEIKRLENGGDDSPTRGLQHVEGTPDGRPLKYDKKTGVLLSPQPTDDPNDPLNWPTWLKWLILCQVSFAAAQTPFCSAIIIPAFKDFSLDYGITLNKAASFVSVAVMLNAWGPLLMQPLSSVYGRRPLYIITFIIATVSSIGGAFCTDYNSQAACRALNGFGLGSAVSIGGSTVTDLFFQSMCLWLGLRQLTYSR